MFCVLGLDLQTSSFFFHIYKIKFTDKQIKSRERQPFELCCATISLLLSERMETIARETLEGQIKHFHRSFYHQNDLCIPVYKHNGSFPMADNDMSQREVPIVAPS